MLDAEVVTLPRNFGPTRESWSKPGVHEARRKREPLKHRSSGVAHARSRRHQTEKK